MNAASPQFGRISVVGLGGAGRADPTNKLVKRALQRIP